MTREPLRIPGSWLPELMTAALAWRGLQETAGTAEAWNTARALLARGADHLPLFLVLDLHTLLRQGWDAAFIADRSRALDADEALRRRYENEILARLLQEGLIEEARRRGADDHERRRRFALGLLIQRLAPLYPKLSRVNPAELRSLPPPAAELLAFERARAILRERCDRNLFAEGLRLFLDAAAEDEAWCRPFDEANLFELRHITLLDKDDARIGCRQVLQLDAVLGPADPRAFPVLEDESAEAETVFVDDSRFPTGGFSELTRRGSLENLVKSELVYMEETELSLFDLRAAEGELLYYLRDSGALLRRRRALHFIIDAPRLYHEKSPRYPWPYSTIILGLIRGLTRDLLNIYKDDAVQARIVFIDHPEVDLTSEHNILSLLLADERAASLVKVELRQDRTLTEALPQDHLARVLVFTDSQALNWRQRLQSLTEERPGARGLILGIGSAGGDLRLPGTGLDERGLQKLRDALLQRIVGG